MRGVATSCRVQITGTLYRHDYRHAMQTQSGFAVGLVTPSRAASASSEKAGSQPWSGRSVGWSMVPAAGGCGFDPRSRPVREATDQRVPLGSMFSLSCSLTSMTRSHPRGSQCGRGAARSLRVSARRQPRGSRQHQRADGCMAVTVARRCNVLGWLEFESVAHGR